MTYRYFVNHTSFDAVWPYLSRIYKEREDIRPSYERLFNSVSELPLTTSTSKIILKRDLSGHIRVENVLDSQEEIIDREVIIENRQLRKLPYNEIVAHILYWSSMYGYLTAAQYTEQFTEWLDDLHQSPTYDEDGMVKYIFLDFDGVLNTEQYQAELAISGKNGKDKYGPLFDPRAVAQLAKLINETGAKIIITSSWRFIHDNETLVTMWNERGLPGKIAYVLVSKSNQSKKDAITEFPIGKYNPYIILDDDTDFTTEQKQYLLQINPVKGLMATNVDKAIGILNRFTDKFFENLQKDRIQKRNVRLELAEIERRSLKRKKLRYWEDIIAGDSPIDWSYNLLILKKKLEYNIGYWKYVRRYVGWEHDVDRMQLCCRLLGIAANDCPGIDCIYVNTRNAGRYNCDYILDTYEFNEYQKQKLRHEKAYSLLWRFIEYNMRKWWD